MNDVWPASCETLGGRSDPAMMHDGRRVVQELAQRQCFVRHSGGEGQTRAHQEKVSALALLHDEAVHIRAAESDGLCDDADAPVLLPESRILCDVVVLFGRAPSDKPEADASDERLEGRIGDDRDLMSTRLESPTDADVRMDVAGAAHRREQNPHRGGAPRMSSSWAPGQRVAIIGLTGRSPALPRA